MRDAVKRQPMITFKLLHIHRSVCTNTYDQIPETHSSQFAGTVYGGMITVLCFLLWYSGCGVMGFITTVNKYQELIRVHLFEGQLCERKAIMKFHHE